MAVILPLRAGVSDYRFRSVLGGDEYAFRCRWNSRFKVWALDAADRTNKPIFTGAWIVLGAYLGRTASHKLTQNGILVPRDLGSPRGREATFDDIGKRVILMYFTIDEAVTEILGTMSGAT